MNRFSELSLCARLADNLAKNNFTQPTPVQAEAIPPALEGRDIVATAQTGTGKTLAFVLPMVERLLAAGATQGVTAIVLSPTRELAMQTSETFRLAAEGTGLRASVVVGGLSENPQLQAIRRGAQVLIATPGRLCDFLERRLVKLDKVQILVLDEGDRMLDMGFQPDIERIVSNLPEVRQTLFFSATVEAEGARLISKYLKDPVRVEIGSTTQPVDSVELHHYEMEQNQKFSMLEQLLSGSKGSFLVFARTRSRADKIATQLSAAGVKAVRIHGDRTQAQRSQALKMFQLGHCRVMVATDVAARGIHVDGIEHVVNFDLPQAPEDFIHRVGRTGRAGAQGLASTFATRSERGEIRRIERTLKTRLTQKHAVRTHVAAPAADAVEPAADAPAEAAPPVERNAGPVRVEAPAYNRKQDTRTTTVENRDRKPAGFRRDANAPRPSGPARETRPARKDDRGPRRSAAPQWEFLTGPEAMREDETVLERPAKKSHKPAAAGNGFKPAGGARNGRPWSPHAPAGRPTLERSEPATGRDFRPNAARPTSERTFQPRWQANEGLEHGRAEGFKPNRPFNKGTGPAKSAGFQPRWESKPKWEDRPRREGPPRFDSRPASRMESPRVGDFTPKWAAKSEWASKPERSVRPERATRNDERPARRGAGSRESFRPDTKQRKEAPWANGPGAGRSEAKPAFSKFAPKASKAAPKKKVLLKSAAPRPAGPAVFPWQGSGMAKMKRRG